MACDVILESMDQTVQVLFFPWLAIARLHARCTCKYALVCVCVRACVYVFCRLPALYRVIICAHLAWQQCPMLDKILLHLHHFPSVYVRVCCYMLTIGFGCMYVYVVYS